MSPHVARSENPLLTSEDAILRLHTAIDHAGLWRGVRALLQESVSFDRLTLFLGHLGMARARIVFTDPPIEETQAWYEERSRLNPFSPFIARNIGRSYYHFHEVVGPPEVFRQSPFYQKFASFEGWDKGLSIMFWNGEEMRAMFSLYRSPSEKDFSSAERDQLLKLARHIEIAIIRVQKIHREENLRAALQQFARTIPASLMLLDWSLTPVFVNLAAYESTAVWNVGRAKAQRLNPREIFRIPEPLRRTILKLKEPLIAEEDTNMESELPRPEEIRHPGDPHLKATITTTKLGPASLARPGFVILFEDLYEQSRPAEDIRFREKALQKLTPAERRVVQQVCMGRRNADIARALNKSPLTVKTQLNTIFQKLNVGSRTELVSLMK
jgi:DNA-binding CsgD family transcriptional regulator